MKQKIHSIAKVIVSAGFYMLLLLLSVGSLTARTDAVVEQYGLKTTWPQDTQWKVIGGVNDPDDLLSTARLDFVGDVNNPGGFYFSDGTYIYFRVRVDADTVASGEYSDTIFVLIDNTGDSKADYGFAWDTNQPITSHGLELAVPSTISTTWSASRMGDADATSGQKISPPDLAPQNTERNDTSDGYVRTLDAQNTMNFGNTTFVEFAVKWSFLEANTTLTKNQTWKITFASINNANDHNTLSYDISGSVNPSANIDTGWSIGVNSNPTASGLGELSARFRNGKPRLNWETYSELNIVGFHVWRANRANTPYRKLNAITIPAKRVGQVEGALYRFMDKRARTGMTYWYRIQVVKADGATEWSGAHRVDVP